MADNSGSVYIESTMKNIQHFLRVGMVRLCLMLTFSGATLLSSCKPNEVEQLQQEVWKNPQDARGYMLLGSAYARAQRYSEASESFAKALALDPKLDDAYHALGAVAFNQKKYREAVPYFQQHLDRAPKDSLRLYNLGNTYMQLKQFDKAAKLYDEAIDNSESFKDAHYNLAVCYIEMGRIKEAEAIYKWLLDKNNYLAVSLQKRLNKEVR